MGNMDVFQAASQFANNASRQNPTLNPKQLVLNMLGIKCNTPQEALDAAFKKGAVSNDYYQMVNGKV